MMENIQLFSKIFLNFKKYIDIHMLLYFIYHNKNVCHKISWAWWHTSVISVLGRLRQEDGKFKATGKTCQNKTKQNNNNQN
jgi:hypothetical protein